MAVAHDAASESHTGTTGSTSETSFSWTHTPTGTPRGVLVFVLNELVSDIEGYQDTGVTYGGVAMIPLPDGAVAVDSSGESAVVRSYFLGDGIPTGAQTVIVNRQNSATVMYAVCATQTAGADTYVPSTWVLVQQNGTLAEQSVDDAGAAAASQRYAFGYTGAATLPTAGANSTDLSDIDFGVAGAVFVRETTPGTGSRSVGATTGSNEDRAYVYLAVAEQPADTVWLESASRSHPGTTESTSEASFSWTHPGGEPNGVTVVVVTRANATAVDTAVTYGGVSLTHVSALNAQDTAGEPGRIQVWHLGSGIPTGPQTIVVTRTNNADAAGAMAWTTRASRATEIDTAGAVVLSGDGTVAEQSVSDTASRGNSLRFMSGFHGGSNDVYPIGANSRFVIQKALSGSGSSTAVEAVPGAGTRSVGFTRDAGDDRAIAAFAVQQVASSGTNASAGHAAGAGAANTPAATIVTDGAGSSGSGEAGGPSPHLKPNAGHASGTGEAFDATITAVDGAEATAEHASGSGTANDATTSIATGAGAGSGTGAASGPGGSLQTEADTATGTGEAFDATTSTATIVNADAGHASGTGEAFDASVSLSASAGAGTGTGSAGGPSSSVSPHPSSGTGTGAAGAPAPALAPAAGHASGLGEALGPTLIIAVGPGHASGTGTAYDVTSEEPPTLPRGAKGSVTVPRPSATITVPVPSGSLAVPAPSASVSVPATPSADVGTRSPTATVEV